MEGPTKYIFVAFLAFFQKNSNKFILEVQKCSKIKINFLECLVQFLSENNPNSVFL